MHLPHGGQSVTDFASSNPRLESSAAELVERLVEDLASDNRIARCLLSIIWIGSRSHELDTHRESDLDIQLVFSAPDTDLIEALSTVLPHYPRLDLSILYPTDVWGPQGQLDFQDGTKGAFFIPVLAAGTLVYGVDFYAGLRADLPAQDVRRSLCFTMREYLARLRVMSVYPDAAKPYEFKKYTLKFLKDALVWAGHLPLVEMMTVTNADLIVRSVEVGLINQEQLPEELLAALCDYESPFSSTERGKILLALEEALHAINRNAD